MNNRAVQLGSSILMLSVLFSVAYGMESVWMGRALMTLIVLGSGFLLSLPFAVGLGIFVIPADLMLIARSPHSLDILIWAGLVSIPLLVNRYVNPVSPEVSNSTNEEESSHKTPGEVESDTETLEFHPEVAKSQDVSEQLQEVLVSRMQAARQRFDFDNLVYFHVRDNEARPGYVINDYGDIKTDFSISTDRARGVGWVLRHQEKLVQEDKQIDWRNLQYHRKPVDPDRVMMVPFAEKQDLVGILVLEWNEVAEEPPDSLEQFLDNLGRLMRIDRSVRHMERREKEVDLMHEVSEIQPLEHDRLDTMYQRITDLVRDLIPADHIEFISDDGRGTDETVVKQRRLFYEKCCEWMQTGKSILRINRIKDFSYQGKNLRKLAPPDVKSFLGGVLQDEEGTLGYLCLDDGTAEFFSSDDEKLLRLLLDRMSGLVRLARRHETVRQERDSFVAWLKRIRSVNEISDPERMMERISEVLVESFSPLGVGIYWKAGDEFQLQQTSEGINPSRRLPADSPLIRRLEDNSNQHLVKFPRIQRLTSYEPPVGADLLKVSPMRVDGDLVGFLTMFYREDPHELTEEFLEYGLPLLTRNLEHAHRYASLQLQHRQDEVTQFPKYDFWKRSLNQQLNDESDRDLVVWRLVVPDFETVVENRGLKRAEQWARSLANRIKNDFPEETTTRFHGTDFGGFTFTSANEIASVLAGVRGDVADWSFPAGQWPGSPQTGYEVFHAPFPDVETMIEAARRDLLDRNQVEDRGKETALDSV